MDIRGVFSSSGTRVVSGSKKHPDNKLTGYPGTRSSPPWLDNRTVLPVTLVNAHFSSRLQRLVTDAFCVLTKFWLYSLLLLGSIHVIFYMHVLETFSVSNLMTMSSSRRGSTRGNRYMLLGKLFTASMAMVICASIIRSDCPCRPLIGHQLPDVTGTCTFCSEVTV